MMLIVIISRLVLAVLLNLPVLNVFGVMTLPIPENPSVLLQLKVNVPQHPLLSWIKDVVLNAFFLEVAIALVLVYVMILVLVILNIGKRIVIVADVLLELVNLHLLLILLVFPITIVLEKEHVIVTELVHANVDMNHAICEHVNVKFVKENLQDAQVMEFVSAMELVLVILDGRVFLEFQHAVVKLNVQTIVVTMESVLVVSVHAMQAGNQKLIVLVLIAVSIVMVKINFVDVTENVPVKLDSMASDVMSQLIAVPTKIVLPVWLLLIAAGVEMLKFVKTLSCHCIVLLMTHC
jgi:hypothetical protein